MQSILNIRIQKLFLITIILKVVSSFLGWKFQSPWILGLVIPLSIMVAYIVLGIYRRDRDVTDEKFADSCYYLGFIFTITSIIFSLFDLPNIGTKIQEIAVRFGAAMVSTVLGLTVRVYLVSFRKDFADAIKDTENAIIDASQKFREHLVIACEKLHNFQSDVDNAARETVERVNMQVESLSKNHADKLTEFFEDLTTRNQAAFTHALDQVENASFELSNSVNGYSQGMRTNLASIEDKVTSFTDAITNRLKSTTFPDDYFSKNLVDPLSQLTTSVNSISQGVSQVAGEVKDSTAVLTIALKSLRTKATNTETSLDKIVSLTAQQQVVLETAQGQLTVLEQLTNTLSNFDTTFNRTITVINGSNSSTEILTAKVESLITEGVQTRNSLESALNAIAVKLAENADATHRVAGKLDHVATADIEAAKTLDILGKDASTAIGKIDRALQTMQIILGKIYSLDSSLEVKNFEPRQDIKIAAELEQDLLSTTTSALQSKITIPGHPLSSLAEGIHSDLFKRGQMLLSAQIKDEVQYAPKIISEESISLGIPTPIANFKVSSFTHVLPQSAATLNESESGR